MYWTSNTSHSIMKAGMDGSGSTIVVSGLQMPMGIVVDYREHKILASTEVRDYWVSNPGIPYRRYSRRYFEKFWNTNFSDLRKHLAFNDSLSDSARRLQYILTNLSNLLGFFGNSQLVLHSCRKGYDNCRIFKCRTTFIQLGFNMSTINSCDGLVVYKLHFVWEKWYFPKIAFLAPKITFLGPSMGPYRIVQMSRISWTQPTKPWPNSPVLALNWPPMPVVVPHIFWYEWATNSLHGSSLNPN